MKRELAARRRVIYEKLLRGYGQRRISDECNIDLFTVQNDISFLRENVGRTFIDGNQMAAFVFRCNLSIDKLEKLIEDAYEDYTKTTDLHYKIILRNQIKELERSLLSLSGEATLSKLNLVQKNLPVLKLS